MARQGLQYKIATSRITLPVTFVLTLLAGGIMGWLIPESGADDPYIFRRLLWQWIPGEWTDRLLTLLCHFFVGYLLIELNNAYAVIRIRTSLQASVYGWLLLASPYLFAANTGPLVSCCLILSLYYLFRGYQQHEPVGDVFHAWLFFGIGTLLFPPAFWLMPLMWIGAYQLKALTWRTFFAGLIGMSVPYWFLLCFAYYQDRMDLFAMIFADLTAFQPVFSSLPPYPVLGSSALLFLLWIVGSIHYMVTSYEDKIRTRSYLNFLITLALACFLLGLLQPQHAVMLLSVLLPVIGLVGTHLVALSHGRLSNLFLFLFLGLVSALFIYNIWMLSYNS